MLRQRTYSKANHGERWQPGHSVSHRSSYSWIQRRLRWLSKHNDNRIYDTPMKVNNNDRAEQLELVEMEIPTKPARARAKHQPVQTTAQRLASIVKSARDIMRKDKG